MTYLSMSVTKVDRLLLFWDAWSKNNVIKTTDQLQRIGSRKQENLFASHKWMWNVGREKCLIYHTSCLKFHIGGRGQHSNAHRESNSCRKGSFFVAMERSNMLPLGHSPDPQLHDGILKVNKRISLSCKQREFYVHLYMNKPGPPRYARSTMWSVRLIKYWNFWN